MDGLTESKLLKYKNIIDNMKILPEIKEFIDSKKNNISTNYKYNSRNKDRDNNNNNKGSWLLTKKFCQDDSEKMCNQYRNILNKLSDDNFNNLAKELINLQINTQEQLVKLVEIIFQKAISEFKFVEVYAKLSKELASYYIENTQDSKKIYFRELLINKCQETFNKSTSIEKNIDKNNQDNLEKNYEVHGCIKFIGELYKQELLTSKIIHSCFIHLFAKINLNKAYIVDSICILLKIVGKEFHKKSNIDAKACMEKLEKIKQSSMLQIKEKFAIMDILELAKKEQWN